MTRFCLERGPHDLNQQTIRVLEPHLRSPGAHTRTCARGYAHMRGQIYAHMRGQIRAHVRAWWWRGASLQAPLVLCEQLKAARAHASVARTEKIRSFLRVFSNCTLLRAVDRLSVAGATAACWRG